MSTTMNIQTIKVDRSINPILLNRPEFTDRSSYLAWRRDWRIAYRCLSLQIRQLKAAVSAAQSKGQKRASRLQVELCQLREHARRAIVNRANSKRMAKAQADTQYATAKTLQLA